MSKLAQIKVKADDFSKLIKNAIEGNEYSITEDDGNGKPVKRMLTKKGKIFLGNGFSVSIASVNDDVYFSSEFLTVEDRIEIAKYNKAKNSNNN